MDKIVICKQCGRPEYWGEMRWLSGKCTCRNCYRQLKNITSKKERIKTMALIDMVNSYQELLEKKESLAEATKENNELIEAMKQEIAQQMIDDDCPRIASGDYMFSLQIKNQFSKKSEADLAAGGLDFFEVLREQGFGELIKETVNPRSLQSAMKELVAKEGELPPELAEVISQYDQTDILRRKQTSSALKKAKGGK